MARDAVGSPTVWWDGRTVPWADATVHVLSASLQRGTLAFDVLRIVGGGGGRSVVGLREHVERFAGSATGLGMVDLPPIDELCSAVLATGADHPEATVVKICALWPDVVLDLVPAQRRPSIVIAAVSPAELGTPAPSSAPLRLRLGRRPKAPAGLLSPQWKLAASYTASVIERIAAVEAGFDDVLLPAADGSVAEGPAQSFVLVADGALAVPGLDTVLDGVTRRVVIDLADDLGVDTRVGPIAVDDLGRADEAFLSSTMAAVRPVAEVEGTRWPAPGPVTAALADAADRLYAGDHPLSTRWLTPVESA